MERGYTTIDENNIVYEWKIDKINFFLNSKINFTHNSSEFSSGSIFKDTWRIKSVFDSRENADFYLCLTSDHHELNVKFSFYVLDNKKEKICIKEYQESVSKGERMYYALIKKVLLANEDKYLPDNTLTVCLDLTVYGTSITTSTKLELNIPKHLMGHDYTELYNSRIGSDTIINVGDTTFETHRSILMARSSVLAAMFSHEMIEKKDNKISIPDITPEIFEKVLEYIYTDKVTGLDEIADDLLEAADKYQLLSLKNICQESLSKTLNLENAFKLMPLADRYSAEPLVKFITDFLVKNIKKNNIDIQDFENFKKSHSSLAFKVLEKYSFSKNEY
ncbi:speckle-type POZ protein-like A [Microplitis mediator]|uniref:speckle-type POZ protein-like A n=1 Tax=Microplitis mediator TaxID=375433 RepID=UPI00255720EF|nr:speckle-type POZ protein-like A [Microplitis mediator]XP_057325878.1 speckle-type POZ protein-like A [Microplitis mediator]